MKKVGLGIFIIGVILTIFTAFTFFTREKVVDIGKLEISADKPHHLSWSPLIGIAIMGVGGTVMLISRSRAAH
jgi:hypothetical protein